MIISGWAPVIAWKILSDRRKNIDPKLAAPQPSTEAITPNNDLIK